MILKMWKGDLKSEKEVFSINSLLLGTVRDGNKNYTEDNNVIIDNKLYYKNSQFDQISQKVLEMCNIYSQKSKFNNTTHKSKGGKTMITKGLTIEEFEKKYNIPE